MKSVFSTVTSNIPFINYVDGNRVQMASSMIRQSQYLINAEIPLIIPDQAFIKVDSFSCQIAKDNGLVTDKFNDIILVQYDSGEEDIFYISDLNISKYQIGDRFTKGDIIAHHISYDPDVHLIKFGINANVIFAPYKSKTYEDAIVLTEEGRDKFEYLYQVKFVFELFKNNIITYINDKIKIREILDKGDKLLEYRKISSSLTTLASHTITREFNKYDNLMITDIHVVYKDSFYEQQNEHVKKFLDKYSYIKSDIHPLIKKALKKNFSFDGDCYIVIEGISQRKPVKGDKFANLYGNKGVISDIVPNFELYDDKNDITIIPHLIHTPIGIPSRMNTSQILHMALAYLLKYVIPKKCKQINNLYDKIKFLIKIYGYLQPDMLKTYVIDRIKSMSEEELIHYVNDVEQNGFRIIVKQFTYKLFNKVYNLYKQLDTPFDLYCDKFGLRYGAGVIYSMLLEHLVIKKMKHTSIAPVDSKTLQPTKGQRMGEMEMWTLCSHNTLNFLKESLTIRSDDIVGKNRAVGNIIRFGKTNLQSETSPTLDLLKAYMTLLGLELHEDDEE